MVTKIIPYPIKLLARVLVCILAAVVLGQALYVAADYSVNASNWGWHRAALPASPVRTLNDLSLVIKEQRVVLQVAVETVEGERVVLEPVDPTYGSRQALPLGHLPWLLSDTTCGPPRFFQWHQRPPATVDACRWANVGGSENSLTAAAILDTDGVVWLNSYYSPGYLILFWMVGSILLPVIGLIGGVWWAGKEMGR